MSSTDTLLKPGSPSRASSICNKSKKKQNKTMKLVFFQLKIAVFPPGCRTYTAGFSRPSTNLILQKKVKRIK